MILNFIITEAEIKKSFREYTTMLASKYFSESNVIVFLAGMYCLIEYGMVYILTLVRTGGEKLQKSVQQHQTDLKQLFPKYNGMAQQW